METIITTALSTITGLVIGFLIKSVKHAKEWDNVQSETLKNLLKSNLVNQYFVYKKIGKVPVQVKETWYSMYESYVKLNGNSFVKDDIKPKWDKIESYED